MARFKQRPPGSTWGDFGADDEIGRLNLLDQTKVLQAVQEVKTGRVFCLSLPLDLPGGNVLNPRRHPPILSPTLRDDGKAFMNVAMSAIQADAIDVMCDDQVTLCMQYSTQWDGLSHLGAMFDTQGDGQLRKVYYNGYEAGIDVLGGENPPQEHMDCCGDGASYARKLSVHKYAEKGMQGRGVLVDLVQHFGGGRNVIDGQTFINVLEKDKISVESGDMLVIRTGFAEAVVEMDGKPTHEGLEKAGAVLDGADQTLLNWITDSGIAAICTDNYAVEAYPANTSGPGRSILPLHHHCLFKLGVPLAELWYLRDLALWLREHSRHHFLLTAPPLRLPGAAGSPVTPIATV